MVERGYANATEAEKAELYAPSDVNMKLVKDKFDSLDVLSSQKEQVRIHPTPCLTCLLALDCRNHDGRITKEEFDAHIHEFYNAE